MNSNKRRVFSKNKPVLDYFYEYGIVILVIVLFSVFSILSPKFLEPKNIVNLLIAVTPMGIVVIGMALVIISGGIDISAGSIVFACAAVSVLCGNAGFGFALTLLLAVVTGCVAGAINGFVISRWKTAPLITTLATMALFRGIILLLTQEGYIIHEDPIFSDIILGTKIFGLPVIVLFFILFAIAGQYILNRTKYGWHLYAMGNNMEASEKLGINVRRITFSVYMVNGLLAGLSGFIYMGMIGALTSGFGNGQEFIMITAAVLGGVSLSGGKGKIFPGAVFGILVTMTIENGLNFISASPFAYTIVRGIVIYLAIMIDSIRNEGKLQ